MARNFAGIDFGTTRLRAAEVDANRQSPTILSHGSVPVPEGLISHGTVTDIDATVELLRELWSTSDIGTKNVRVGMGSTTVLIRDLVVPKSSRQRMKEALPFHVADKLPFPVDEAILDFLPVAQVEADASTVNGLLVAARAVDVHANVEAVSRAGLHVESVDVVPFATARLVAHNNVGEGGLALVDIGATATTMTVLIGGVPRFVRIVPTGGQAITERLAADLGVDLQRAELLKVRIGMTHQPASTPEKVAVDSVIHAAHELIESVRSTLQFFMNANRGITVASIRLLGGGSQLLGLKEALTAATDLPATFARPFGKLTFGPRVDEAHARAHTAEYAVALGLALRGNE
ncbi:type IV pilus assembly protein PilM [Plantibacter flavus]|uniref:Type IV pilus assembly protein PilM n=1 Tax=Plantibacter flavus TaxID=150123 RepID=A0A3N2BXL8_9MICO|nr:type IV pilus assembly protein PilM [Plantibacter flavus]ROR80013.1 type IV pilus assembly protein PilM [Plantibacter flavus]SMG28543.1 type IV pilus assembly protein PilM [Plantibacter flavus]